MWRPNSDSLIWRNYRAMPSGYKSNRIIRQRFAVALATVNGTTYMAVSPSCGFFTPASGEVSSGTIALLTPDGTARQVAAGIAFPNGSSQLIHYFIGISPEQGFDINPALLAAHAPGTE